MTRVKKDSYSNKGNPLQLKKQQKILYHIHILHLRYTDYGFLFIVL